LVNPSAHGKGQLLAHSSLNRKLDGGGIGDVANHRALRLLLEEFRED
jgi:hypothetical protein